MGQSLKFISTAARVYAFKFNISKDSKKLERTAEDTGILVCMHVCTILIAALVLGVGSPIFKFSGHTILKASMMLERVVASRSCN